MGKFGEVAISAVGRFTNGLKSPREAWDTAASSIFKKESMKQKGCPRYAFLGLCERGYIKGIPPGKYTDSEKNSEYGVMAVKILKEEPNLENDKVALWDKIAPLSSKTGNKLTHNGQMDVVIALWMQGLTHNS